MQPLALVRYHLSGQDFYIVVEGGARVLYDPAAVRTLPATFGLPAAHDAVVVHVRQGRARGV